MTRLKIERLGDTAVAAAGQHGDEAESDGAVLPPVDCTSPTEYITPQTSWTS